MAFATPDKAPGYYLEGITVDVDFDQSVINVVQNLNGIPPALSKYIAYDQLDPPNPFLAVTQDGKGNVVYDGGFPKFYNTYAPAVDVTSFSQLSASHKFMHNAMNFIANPTKVSAGNRKILVIGDAAPGDNYALKSTAANGFITTISRILSVGGWTPTFKDSTDWGGQINCTLAELEQYAGVIFMSTDSTGVVKITNNAITDLVTYRANGSGMMFVTDHGRDIENTSAALTPAVGDFFTNANQVMINFGAWFSGTYGRSPVNVGYIRTNYGDHPLYDGMLDSESIHADASESRVFVTTYPDVLPGNVPVVQITEPGTHKINLLVELTDGTVHTYQFVYVIATGAIVAFRDKSNTTDVNEINIGYRDTFIPSDNPIVIRGQDLGTLNGTISRAGEVIGHLVYSQATGQSIKIRTGDKPVRVNDRDVIEAKITSPFEFTSQLTVRRFQPVLETDSNLGEVVKKLAANGTVPNRRRALQKTLDEIKLARPDLTFVYRPSSAGMLNAIRRYMRNEELLPPFSLHLFFTDAAVSNALNTMSATDPTYSLIGDAFNNRVYTNTSGSWQLIAGKTLHQVLGSPRVLTDLNTGSQYRLNLDGGISTL